MLRDLMTQCVDHHLLHVAPLSMLSSLMFLQLVHAFALLRRSIKVMGSAGEISKP